MLSIIMTLCLFSSGRHVSLVVVWEQWDVTIAVALVQNT